MWPDLGTVVARRPARPMRARARRIGRALLLLLALAASPLVGANAMAQTPSPSAQHDRFWFTGGLGLGFSGNSRVGRVALAGSFGATYQTGSKLLSLRTAGIWGMFDGDAVGDIALLAGLGTHNKSNHASLAIGPGVSGGEVGAFLSKPSHLHSTLGLAFQVQGFQIAFGALGLGLYGFGNLNSQRSFGGAALSLQFGKLQ